jgi:hypothetical protein
MKFYEILNKQPFVFMFIHNEASELTNTIIYFLSIKIASLFLFINFDILCYFVLSDFKLSF